MTSSCWDQPVPGGLVCARVPLLHVELEEAASLYPLGRALVSPNGTIDLSRLRLRANKALFFSLYCGKALLWRSPVRPQALAPFCRGPHPLAALTGAIVYGLVKAPDAVTPSVLLKLYAIEEDRSVRWLSRLGSTMSGTDGFYWLRVRRRTAPNALLRVRAFDASHSFLGSAVAPLTSVCRLDMSLHLSRREHV